MTTITDRLVRWLPQPLLKWLVNARTVVRQPTALTTVRAAFRPALGADSEAPWWNDRAVRFLGQQLRPGDRVFEWGSGASTIWLSSRGAKVTSIEHDADWVSQVKERCPGVDLRTAPDDVKHYVAAIDEFDDGSLDVVIVDGLFRPECLHRAVSKVKPNGLLVLDDSDQRRLRPLKRSLPGWKTVSFAGFKSTGDARETTFFRRPEVPDAARRRP